MEHLPRLLRTDSIGDFKVERNRRVGKHTTLNPSHPSRIAQFCDTAECEVCFESLFHEVDDTNTLIPVAAMAGCGHIFHAQCLHLAFQTHAVKSERLPLVGPNLHHYFGKHLDCPKCRSVSPACRDGRCRSMFSHDEGVYFYACLPCVPLFIKPTAGEEHATILDPIQGTLPIVLRLKQETVHTYDLAKMARDLGLDLDDLATQLDYYARGDQIWNWEWPFSYQKRVKSSMMKLEEILQKLKQEQSRHVLNTSFKEIQCIILGLERHKGLIKHQEQLHIALQVERHERSNIVEDQLQSRQEHWLRERQFYQLELRKYESKLSNTMEHWNNEQDLWNTERELIKYETENQKMRAEKWKLRLRQALEERDDVQEALEEKAKDVARYKLMYNKLMDENKRLQKESGILTSSTLEPTLTSIPTSLSDASIPDAGQSRQRVWSRSCSSSSSCATDLKDVEQDVLMVKDQEDACVGLGIHVDSRDLSIVA